MAKSLARVSDVLRTMQDQWREDAMESETPAHPGLGYSIDTRTVEMIGAIELRVCEEEQISNSCTIADVNRPDKSMDTYPEVAKPPNVIQGT